MRDDPGKNLKWLEQELLSEDTIHRDFSRLPDPEYQKDEELLELVDMLIGEEEPEPQPPVRNFANHYGRKAKAEQVQQTYMPKLDKSAAVLTKTRGQLRREARKQKIADKKSGVNRNITGLVFLAVLECLGILAILGWWLQ